MIAHEQRTYLDDLARLTRETDARVKALVLPLTDEQQSWRPPDGGWSITDVLEHLCVVHDSYDAPLRRILDSPATAQAPDDAQWSPTLVGGMMVKSFMSERRLPAPKMFRPAAAARASVLDEFLARERELLTWMGRARSVHLTRTKLASPVTRLVRINLGDAFGALVHHARRHLGQMERVRARVGFPEG
jgi:hypothetical protein